MKLRGLLLKGPWSSEEVRELTRILSPLPNAWLEDNPHIQTLARSAVLKNAPPDAPGHSKYEPSVGVIVVYDKGVYAGNKLDPEQFRRSVYHELAHALLRHRPGIGRTWPSRTRGDGYVDNYAKTSPIEDFCDSFSEFFIHPDKIGDVVPKKAAFLAKLLRSAQQEKTAMSMIYGFADEMIKHAAGGGLRGMLQSALQRVTASKSGLAKGVGLGGAGALAGGAYGKKKGEEEGYEEGTGNVMDVAQRARAIGRREGAMMYHRAMIQRMRKQQKQ